MKTLAVIALSLVSILASLCFVLYAACAYGGDFEGTGNRGQYILGAIIALAVVVVCMRTIAYLNRKPK